MFSFQTNKRHSLAPPTPGGRGSSVSLCLDVGSFLRRRGLGLEHVRTDRHTAFWAREGEGRAGQKWNGFPFLLASSLALSCSCCSLQVQPVLGTRAPRGAAESGADRPSRGWGWGNSRGSWERRGTAADTPVWAVVLYRSGSHYSGTACITLIISI